MLILKILYSIIKFVKCIICKTTNNTYIRKFSVAKVDYRGAAAPKNVMEGKTSLNTHIWPCIILLDIRGIKRPSTISGTLGKPQKKSFLSGRANNKRVCHY